MPTGRCRSHGPAAPVEILLGIYLGVLTGIFPALVAWGLGFLFKYLTGVSLPAFGVVVLALAGINGGLLALSDPTVVGSGSRIVVALLVVLLVSDLRTREGRPDGSRVPETPVAERLRERTLSSDVVSWSGHAAR